MKKIKWLVIAVLSGMSAVSNAEDLMQVYQQAVRSDPIYQNAIATYRDNYEALPQSVAGLLPAIFATAGTNFTRSYNNALPGTKYNSNQYQISLTQPIINVGNWMQVQSAQAMVKAALANVLAAKQNLMIRVSNAYFYVLQAEDNLRFIRAQKRAVYQQLEQTEQRFKVGLDAMTSVYSARAQYDEIVAQEIAAQNAINNQREVLRQITGCYYEHLAPLKANLPLLTPNPSHVAEWVGKAEQQNMGLMASRFTALAAKANVKVQFAGHLPTLNATGSYQEGRTHQASVNNINHSEQSVVGLQLSMPIFEGGAIVSKTNQAEYRYMEAVTQMETIYRATVAMTHETFNSIISGISQIKADRQAIISRISSLNATQAAFSVGTRTIVDVLNDQQALTQAQEQYATDQYSYITNTLLLKQAAGQLDESDIEKINHWLNPKASANYDRVGLETTSWSKKEKR